MQTPDPEILRTRVEATMTVPVDLSTDLDHANAAPVIAEHEIVVAITSPNPPRTLVNALAVSLDVATRAVVGDDPDSVVSTDVYRAWFTPQEKTRG